MDDEKKNFMVYIFGSEYMLKANSDSDIVKIAAYVDQKMREIHTVKMNRPLHQIAILSALNIAEELFQLRQSAGRDYQDLKEKINKLATQLELGIDNPLEADEALREE